MKNKCLNFVFFLLISCIINAAEQTSYPTTVNFLGHFNTPQESWTSGLVKVKVRGLFSASINSRDGIGGILHNLEIIKRFGQKPIGQEDALAYTYPDYYASREEIRAKALWNYRAFEIESVSKDSKRPGRIISGEHKEALCEYCQLTGINCANGNAITIPRSAVVVTPLVAAAVIARNDAVMSRGGAVLSRGRGGANIAIPRSAVVVNPLVAATVIARNDAVMSRGGAVLSRGRGGAAIAIPRPAVVITPLVAAAVIARNDAMMSRGGAVLSRGRGQSNI